MDDFSLNFLGWFYSIACGAAIIVGIAILMFLYVRGQVPTRYKDYSIWNDVMMLVIWAIGLGGAIGVLQRSQWGQFLLQLFCWMLIALSVLSGTTRLLTLRKVAPHISRQEWKLTLIGVTLIVLPIVLFCVATILSLRTEEARQAFGMP